MPRVAAAQDGLDDAAHALFLQLVRQLVEVCAARQDELLSRRVDVVHFDGPRTVPAGLVVETRASAQRVHQPRLAAGLLPHGVPCLRRKGLAGFLGVLRQQAARFRGGEVAQAQRLRRDVERAAAGDDLAGARADPVVADVAHATKHHALRETSGTPLVAGAELAQHGKQRVAHQRVDLVHQQHQRRRIRSAPARQQHVESAFRPCRRQHVLPHAGRIVVAQLVGVLGQAGQNGADAARGVVAGHLADLHVHVNAAEIAGLAAVEQIAQRDQGGGLARLPRRVQHEVALRLNQVEQFADTRSLQRLDRVVVVQAHRPFGVETTHRAIIAPAARSESARHFGTRAVLYGAEPYAAVKRSIGRIQMFRKRTRSPWSCSTTGPVGPWGLS